MLLKEFLEVGLIERYGSGIKRILTICFDYGVIPPNFEEIHNGFKVILFKEKLNVVEERRKKIMNIIVANNKISAKNIAKLLGITERTIQRDLKKLKELKQIVRIGADSTGYWEIINKNNKK